MSQKNNIFTLETTNIFKDYSKIKNLKSDRIIINQTIVEDKTLQKLKGLDVVNVMATFLVLILDEDKKLKNVYYLFQSGKRHTLMGDDFKVFTFVRSSYRLIEKNDFKNNIKNFLVYTKDVKDVINFLGKEVS